MLSTAVLCSADCELQVKDASGLTVEGLQEFYDEACLAVLNNKYQVKLLPVL